MEALRTGPRPIVEAAPDIDRLWPAPSNKTEYVDRYPSLEQTVQAMVEVARTSTWQTEKVAPLLRGATVRETVGNVHRFLYTHYQYALDREGNEELRTPARAWADRKKGVDCDCLSITAACLLANLGIASSFRVADYGRVDASGQAIGWEHVYVVAHNGSERIPLDAVINLPYKEVPYRKIKDFKAIVKLLKLSGVSSEAPSPPQSELETAWDSFTAQQMVATLDKIAPSIRNGHYGMSVGMLSREQFLEFYRQTKKTTNVEQLRARARLLLIGAGIFPKSVNLGVIDPISIVSAGSTVVETAGNIGETLGKIWDKVSGFFDSLFGPGPFSAEVEERMKETVICVLWLFQEDQGAIRYFQGTKDFEGRADRREQVQKSARINIGLGAYESALTYFRQKLGMDGVYELLVHAMLNSPLPVCVSFRTEADKLPRHHELSTEQDRLYYLPAIMAAKVGFAVDRMVFNGVPALEVIRKEMVECLVWAANDITKKSGTAAPSTGNPNPLPTLPGGGTATPGQPLPGSVNAPGNGSNAFIYVVGGVAALGALSLLVKVAQDSQKAA